MQKLKTIFLATVCLAFCGTFLSAQAQSSDKRNLIAEFRKLTGANNVTGSINFPSDSIREFLSSIVAQDKELNDAQRQSLGKSVDEATARVAKTAHSFLSDKTQIAELSEEVIYRIYDTTFTVAELKELIAFYRTPAGQKAAVFLPSLSTRVQTEFGIVIQQKLQALIQPMLQTESEQLKQKIKDAKAGKASDW